MTGPGVGDRRHRVVRALRLRVPRELEVGVRRDRRRGGVRDVVGDVDHVAAAMERQHLHDPVAVRGDRRELEVEPLRAGCELVRARLHGVRGPVVRHALAEQPRLRHERALGRPEQREVGFRFVARIAMLEERDFDDRAAGRIDGRAIEIRDDRDGASRRRGLRLRPRRNGRGRGSLGRRGAARRRRQVGRGRRLRGRRRHHRRRRPEFLLPRFPQHQRREREDDEPDETLGIHDCPGDRARKDAARKSEDERIRGRGRIRLDGTGGSAERAGRRGTCP